MGRRRRAANRPATEDGGGEGCVIAECDSVTASNISDLRSAPPNRIAQRIVSASTLRSPNTTVPAVMPVTAWPSATSTPSFSSACLA
jgi:hypothetical protein